MRCALLLVVGCALTGCFLSHASGSDDLGGAADAGSAPDADMRLCSPATACGAHAYCLYPAGDECGRAGGAGVCTPAPFSCPALGEHPVCGCDGMTYMNFCPAISRGVSISSDGACP